MVIISFSVRSDSWNNKTDRWGKPNQTDFV